MTSLVSGGKLVRNRM